MPPLPWTRLLLAVALLVLAAAGARAEYSEQLTLRSLPAVRKAAARFRLVLREPMDAPAALFPPALAQILDAYDADALHLSFALGRYSRALLGEDADDALAAGAPFGTRLQVDLRADANASAADPDVRRRWRGLTAELGGVFSASLAQMDDSVVVGLLDDGDTQRAHLGALPLGLGLGLGDAPDRAPSVFLHGSLAREELCTENLTPWLKMLPCRTAAGLGRLVDPVKFLSGEYLALSLAAARSLETREWTLQQQLTLVRRVDRPGAGADASPSLSDLFLGADAGGDGELAACPLAASSVLVVDGRASDLRRSAVSMSAPIFPAWTRPEDGPEPVQDVVEVHRFATGHGQVRGGIAVRLSNHHASSAARVVYHDVLPWFLRVYLSSLRVVGAEPRALAFAPAELRGRPNQLRVELELPARSSAVLSVQFDKAFLRLSEHPPDANRGFDVAPGVAVFTLLGPAGDREEEEEEEEGGRTWTLFTEPLLVPLPTPDFSMPYNVITMTSTVVAFFVGSMLNSLLRKAPRIQQLMAKAE